MTASNTAATQAADSITINKTPLDMLFERAQSHPNKIYLRQPVNGVWTEYSWADVASQVRRIAAGLKEMGVQKGDKVAIAGRNTAHWIMADLAAMAAGAVGVGLYPKMSAEHVAFVLEHSEAKAVFIGPADDADVLDATISSNITRIRMPYDSVTIRCDKEWDALLKNEPMSDSAMPQLDDNDVIGMIYTSGTTGNPKGVMLTLGGTKFSMGGLLQVLGDGDDEHWFSYLPLAHIFERGVTESASLYQGATVSFLESLDKMAQQLAEVAPTRFVAVPLVWTRFQKGILEKMPQQKLDRLLKIPILKNVVKKKLLSAIGLQNARLCISGAAPLAPATIEWFAKLGINVMQGYGMSENSAYCSTNTAENNRIGSVGKPNPGCEIKIDDSGEILTRHPATFVGYFKDEAKTKETLTSDGWLHTGDRGKLDNDGYLWITGRVKDIFKTDKGKYIAPAPIENKLAKNEFIEQLCLLGAGHKQPVMVAITAENAATVSNDDIAASLAADVEALNATLESQEKIAKIIVTREAWTIEGGELTPTMKVRRHAIEERYNDEIPGWYNRPESVIWLS